MSAESAAAREAASRAGLARMKWLALGLLFAMAVLFAATHVIAGAQWWTGYVRAFAEAAMVGALADWFAVTALFRYPLGLPIPHTAIIPRRKDLLGDSLARFVSENFLVPDALRPRLEGTDFAASAGVWIARPENARRLAADVSGLLEWLLDTLDDRSLREFVRGHLHLGLREVQVTPLLGRVMDLLTTADRHQELMDVAVRIAREQLEENRHLIREKIETQSPWWIPDFVDREIYDRLVSEIENTLDRIGTDRHHEARQRFNEGTRLFIERLKTDPEIIARGEVLKEELLGHPAVQTYLANIWTYTSGFLVEEARREDSALRARLQSGIAGFGEALLVNGDVRARVNRWLRDATLYLVGNYRAGLASVISDTVRAWDPEVTALRVELAVGRDLQFIRINGTLVGGLAGLAIHALVESLT